MPHIPKRSIANITNKNRKHYIPIALKVIESIPKSVEDFKIFPNAKGAYCQGDADPYQKQVDKIHSICSMKSR